jgi:hypothetical protein
MAQNRTVNYLSRSGPPHLDFAGGDGQVTVGEKRASVRGQMSRGTLGGTTGRDRCKRGKACGVTCIAANEDCIIDFPEPVQGQLQKMAQFILDRRTKEGRAISEEEDIELGKGVGMLGRQLTQESKYQRGSGKYKKETTERTFGTTQYGQQRMLSNKEIESLKANKDKIAGSENDEQLRKAWQTDTQSRGVKLKKKDLEDLYDSLDMAAQQQLNATGSPGAGKFYGGTNSDGTPITNAKSANKERGLAVLDLYLKQGGTDAYQLGSGKTATRVFSPADLDIEHVKPMERSGKNPDSGKDEPGNWVLARSGAQRTRSDSFFKDFIDSLPDTKDSAAMSNYYSAERRKQQATRAMNKLSKDIYNNRNKYSDEEFLKMVKLTKPPAKKSGEYSVNPIAKKIFRDEKGQQDGFFVGTVLNNPAGGKPIPQPAGWAKAYLLERRVGTPETATALRAEIRNIWNNRWLGGQIDTQQMVNEVANAYKSKLSPQAWNLVKGEVESGSQSILQKYGSAAPGNAAPAATPKGRGMSQKEAEDAIADLIKSL